MMDTTLGPIPRKSGDQPKRSRELTPIAALRLAWIWWSVLLMLPFFVFILVIWALILGLTPQQPTLGYVFFALSLLWMLITMPAAFILRDYCFSSYWQGYTVEPRSYLRGMLTIWLAPEIGGLLALTGCLLSGSLMPNLLPAVAAFMLFTPFWPTGRAMIEPVGKEDDDQIFRHPR